MNISEFHKNYSERMKGAVRKALNEVGLKGNTGSMANALVIHAFEEKKLIQDKIEWIIKSWIDVDDDKARKLAYLIWKEMI